MILYKDFIKSQLLNKRVRFVSDCIVKIDVTGVVIDAENSGSEIIYIVNTGNRIVKIGENTSKLSIEIL